MTPSRFKSLFPQATADAIRLNCGETSKHDHTPHRPLSDSKPEHHAPPALGAAAQGEEKGVPRATVRFVGYRVRPLDPDNFAGSVKDLLDGLRHAALISGDEPWRIRLETEQVKVAHYEDERTEIEIDLP